MEIQRRRLIDSLLLQRLQHSHPLLHQHEDPTNSIASWIEWTRCLQCLPPMCSTPRISLHTSRDRSLHCLHRSTTCPWRRDQLQSLISSSLFGHSSQKGGENFEGIDHSLGIQSLVHTGNLALFMFWFKLFQFL